MDINIELENYLRGRASYSEEMTAILECYKVLVSADNTNHILEITELMERVLNLTLENETGA